MTTPTNGAPFDSRVMIEVVTAGVPRRVNLWTLNGETYVSFPPDTTEAQASEIVGRALGMLRPLDVAVLFREGGKRRRFIETE